jgi:glucose-6-phosphate dehydrogenase assembly protein OpcA
MATEYKILGQINPSATTNTTLYTVPADTQAVISTIVIANLTSNAETYRIALRPAGEALANKHYIAYDVTVGGNDSTTLTLGVTLASTDVVTVYGSTDSLAFNLSGMEVS